MCIIDPFNPIEPPRLRRDNRSSTCPFMSMGNTQFLQSLVLPNTDACAPMSSRTSSFFSLSSVGMHVVLNPKNSMISCCVKFTFVDFFFISYRLRCFGGCLSLSFIHLPLRTIDKLMPMLIADKTFSKSWFSFFSDLVFILVFAYIKHARTCDIIAG